MATTRPVIRAIGANRIGHRHESWELTRVSRAAVTHILNRLGSASLHLESRGLNLKLDQVDPSRFDSVVATAWPRDRG